MISKSLEAKDHISLSNRIGGYIRRGYELKEVLIDSTDVYKYKAFMILNNLESLQESFDDKVLVLSNKIDTKFLNIIESKLLGNGTPFKVNNKDLYFNDVIFKTKGDKIISIELIGSNINYNINELNKSIVSLYF